MMAGVKKMKKKGTATNQYVRNSYRGREKSGENIGFSMAVPRRIEKSEMMGIMNFNKDKKIFETV